MQKHCQKKTMEVASSRLDEDMFVEDHDKDEDDYGDYAYGGDIGGTNSSNSSSDSGSDGASTGHNSRSHAGIAAGHGNRKRRSGFIDYDSEEEDGGKYLKVDGKNETESGREEYQHRLLLSMSSQVGNLD